MAIHLAIFPLQLSTTYISHMQLHNCATTGKLYTVSCIYAPQNASYAKSLPALTSRNLPSLHALRMVGLQVVRSKARDPRKLPAKLKPQAANLLDSRHFQVSLGFRHSKSWSGVEPLIEGFNSENAGPGRRCGRSSKGRRKCTGPATTVRTNPHFLSPPRCGPSCSGSLSSPANARHGG